MILFNRPRLFSDFCADYVCVDHTSVDFSQPLLFTFVDYNCTDWPVFPSPVLITLVVATFTLTTLVLTTRGNDHCYLLLYHPLLTTLDFTKPGTIAPTTLF